ncbi:MAG: hypothetical protein ACRD68_01590, partial [Pyrinomonadaceae bacterium]
MSYLRWFCLCAAVLFTGGASFAQQAEGALPRDADRAALDDLRAQGSEALYNLDYEEARRVFNEMRRRFPDHPAGPHSLASSLWLQ